MGRADKAIVSAAFLYAQFALALLSGFVLFPLVVGRLGAYDNGLWLATGEVVGYLLLGDLGIFAVLPWMIATKDGAGDRAGISRHLADALGLGSLVGIGFAAMGVAVWAMGSMAPGFAAEDWSKVQTPLAVLLCLTGLGFPLRTFTALLVGLQDVSFGGLLLLFQGALTVGLTAGLILSGFGMLGLAIAAGVPPVLTGLAAGVRAFTAHGDLMRVCGRPSWAGCRDLLGQGFGAWLGGLGARLMTASNGIILSGIGRPDLGTVFAGTGKAAQVLHPMCGVVPDSGLVGLGQLHAEGDASRTRRTVLCLLLLYLLVPGAAALALLAANPAFVSVWLGPDLYAGHYVSALIALNLVVASVGGGMFKVVGVIGHRMAVGSATVVAGALYLGLGFGLGWARGLDGVAEAALLTWAGFVLPCGMYLVAKVYGISPGTFLREAVGPWAMRTVPLMAAAAAIGTLLVWGGLTGVLGAVGAAIVLGGAYLFSVRSLIGQAPWPSRIRSWLTWVRLVPALQPVVPPGP